MFQAKRIIEEGFLGAFSSITVGIVAGLGLVMMRKTLEEMGGMLVMIPAFVGMRGNISGSLSSRLGTALHRGTLKPVYTWSRDIAWDVFGFMILGTVTSLLIGVFTFAVCVLLGFPNAGVVKLTLTSFIAGILSNLVMIPLTCFFEVFFYRRGLDPDTIMGPYITSAGDIVGIVALFVVARIILHGW